MITTTLSYLKSNTGRPNSRMTDYEWQEIFKFLKLTTKPSKHKLITTCKSRTNIDVRLGMHAYHGDTLNQNWCKVLNDNLKQIRKGRYDFVYYIYNIAELLKYEHERLRSRYNQDEQYFEIWLDN